MARRGTAAPTALDQLSPVRRSLGEGGTLNSESFREQALNYQLSRRPLLPGNHVVGSFVLI